MKTNFSCPNTAGIYKIINKIDGRYYVGSSTNIFRRWNDHKRRLCSNYHVNEYLQRCWNKYGENAFDFVIVETVDKKDLLLVEQEYLENAKLDGKERCYNLCFLAGSGGSFLNRKHSTKTKQLISDKLTGRYRGVDSPHYGKHHTTETRKKMSDLRKGTPSPNRGKTMTMEQKEKIRQSLLKRYSSC